MIRTLVFFVHWMGACSVEWSSPDRNVILLFCRSEQKIEWIAGIAPDLSTALRVTIELNTRFKLLEESHIVFVEHSDVSNLVQQHRYSFDSHSESKTVILLRIDTTVF